MASNNYAKTHLTEFRNSEKDTVSEASESGTSTSVTSEDLQKLAVILGLNSAEDVYQERFRIDRRRLETMLADNLQESQTAQAFFNRVMNETNTLINWPARLKIGARSKKDPHVRVAGRPDDVKLAREKIMQLLDTRNNRVTMKIDVSYTDHSHIIGKGGLTIKRVMEETGCHIHFPDSNRTSALEKSNQVSIAGDMERVERARARVRALTPLVFCFELPIVAASQPLPDVTSPYVQQIQDTYNVHVMIRNRPKLHANLMVVKGVQWEVRATMEATTLLMNYMCGPLANQTKVQMNLEISPMHHSVVVGQGSEQLKLIMRGTGAQIMFPDANDPNIPPLKKSCVTITGQINDVYAARQQLVGSLPLVVIFDMPDSQCTADGEVLSQLMARHNVYVNIRRKPKQGIASIVIKGIERCAGDIYEARRELLGGQEPMIAAEIPESYNIPAATGAMPSFDMFNLFSQGTHNMGNSPCSPFNMPPLQEFGSPFSGLAGGAFGSPLSPSVGGLLGTWMLPSPQPQPHPFHFPTAGAGPSYYSHQPTWTQVSTSSDMGGMQESPMMQQSQMMQSSFQPISTDPMPGSLGQVLNASSQASSSGYQSNFTGSCVSLDHNVSGAGTATGTGGEGSSVASPSISPISKGHSPVMNDHDRSQQELANLIQELPLSERRAPGFEKQTLEALGKMSPASDYRQLRSQALKAMRESSSGYRVPTPKWVGYYFSNTSPGAINLREKMEEENSQMNTPERGWNRSELSRPRIVTTSATPPSAAPTPTPGPSAAVPPPPKRCRYEELYQMLNNCGLHKYVELFKKHELDMSTFQSLTEADLMEIGVTAFGARRKMLLIIAELQEQRRAKASGAANTEHRLFDSPPYDAAKINDHWG